MITSFSILIIPPIIISLVHLFGLNFKGVRKKLDEILHSLAAGISIAYVFLLLLPEVFNDTANVFNNLVLILFGLVIFHVPLKYVFLKTESDLKEEYSDLIHGLSISLYGFLVSFIVVDIFKTSLIEGIILLIIVIVHNFLSDITTHDESRTRFTGQVKKFLIVIAPIIGGLVAIFIGSQSYLNTMLLSFAAGSVLYIVFREEIPKQTEGRPIYFLIGVIVLLVISLLLK